MIKVVNTAKFKNKLEQNIPFLHFVIIKNDFLLDNMLMLIYNINTYMNKHKFNITEGDEFVDRNYCFIFDCFNGYFYNGSFNSGNTAYNKKYI